MWDCRIKYKDCVYFLKYTNFKDNFTEYECLCCKKNYEQFFNTYELSNHDINKFILLLGKAVYPYEHMDE